MPYEFNLPLDLPGKDEIEFQPPAWFRRSHGGVRPGTWSDDGAQALCLLASLLDAGRLDIADFSRRLINWHEHGYLAVDQHVFDVGVQTADAIRRLKGGCAPEEAGGREQFSQGNGSLMRVLPLALWHKGDNAELVRDAHLQSLPTHGHPTVQACCALYCLWARGYLRHEPAPWAWAVSELRDLYRNDAERLEALETSIRPEAERTPGGSGFVIDCLFSARWAMEQGGYEDVVKAAIDLGHDTDTTACVAGGLAGIRDGVNAIPERWREGLRGKEELAPLLSGLLRWVEG